jgi:hypothetical protein
VNDRPAAQHTPAESPDDLRIAYFLTSYGSGEQLARLVRTLRRSDPQAPIVVHHDQFAQPLPVGLLDDVPDVHVLDAQEPIVWGDMTLEAARWRVFRWALGHLEFDWLILLSEQDYPIARNSRLRSELAGSGADAIMYGERIDRLEPALADECDRRYSYQYRSLPSLGIERRLPPAARRVTQRIRGSVFEAVSRTQRKVRFYGTPGVMDLPSRIGVRPRRALFSEAFPCWFNDCWFSISRTAVQHVVEYVDAHPEFVRYYERTVIPLESATATIVFNDPELVVDNRSLHTIRWTDPTSGRPDVLGVQDLEYLLASGGMFARKFGSTTDVLDELDRVVLTAEEIK